MSFVFRPAVREQIRLLLAMSGGTGSGKTLSAMKVAKGLAGQNQFAFIDTENGRAKIYADHFPSFKHKGGAQFDVADLAPPFTSERYLEAILAAEQAGYGVIVVDSGSHEYEGEGGILDRHQEAIDRMIKTSRERGDSRPDWQLEESHNMRAWNEAKAPHKRMKVRLLQLKAHVIFCLRAEDKIEMAKEKIDGSNKMKTVIRPKQSLTGLDGWIPICEKRFPFELTASYLLVADKPGYPKPIKPQSDINSFFPADKVITEECGRLLGEWAKGSAASGVQPGGAQGGAPGASPTAGVVTLDIDDIRDIETACADAEVPMVDLLAWLKKKAGYSQLKDVPKDKRQSLLDAVIGLASKRSA